jgi:hypothetical protein
VETRGFGSEYGVKNTSLANVAIKLGTPKCVFFKELAGGVPIART